MKNKVKNVLIVIFLIVFKISFSFGQGELNDELKKLADKTSYNADSLNLTKIDIFSSLPKVATSILKKHDLIKLDFSNEYSVKSISAAECKLVLFREYEECNIALLVYLPSQAGAGSPTLQFTTISKSGKLIDRKVIPYLYFIDPGYEPTQILKFHSERKFELETKAINRVLKNDEFVFKSKEIRKKIFMINAGKIINITN